MQLGIIGVPLVGKTTIFELLTGNRNRIYSSGKTNTAMAKVPDKRIDFLSSYFKPAKTTYAQLEVVDIPGLVPGAEKTAAIFLDAVRKADALLHVVRVFASSSVPVIGNEINPIKDIENIKYELLLADLDLIEKRIERINSDKRKKQMLKELELLEKLKENLENEKPFSTMEFDAEEEEIVKRYQFLTNKPMLICLNVSEEDMLTRNYNGKEELFSYCSGNSLSIIELSANIEKEISELEGQDRDVFLQEMGIEEAGIVRIARTMYERLGLVSFFTVGEDEVKAWTIKKGTPAKEAAGKVHSDMERGFIRAEVVSFDDFKELGSMTAVKEKGLLRLEGKEYQVKDGDIVHFRFNV
ncbi:MAG: redox-regulated ATPase YchF [Syntrophomonadaceae bacterium]|nr:redox-regulated ATPase YchF [Syntrophomonadaceae bacterium]